MWDDPKVERVVTGEKLGINGLAFLSIKAILLLKNLRRGGVEKRRRCGEAIFFSYLALGKECSFPMSSNF